MAASKETLGTHAALVEEFLCPGCVAGYNTKCGAYQPWDDGGDGCRGHCCGTNVTGPHGFMPIALGMPKGFNRPGPCEMNRSPKEAERERQMGRQFHATMVVRFSLDAEKPPWAYDVFNVPVWALEKDGCLFVKVFSPRNNYSTIHVIKGGKREKLCPQAIDIGPEYEEMD